MRFFNKKILTLTYIVAFLVIANSALSQSQDDNVRSMLILNVAEKVYWQNEDTISTFKIGVYSNNKNAYNSLWEVSKGRKIRGKRIQVIYFKRFNSIFYTQILYVAHDKNPEIPKFTRLLEKKQTLLVTDRLEEKDNYMVNLLPVGGKKSIEVDNKNILAHQLKADNTLLLHGGDEDELKVIISETVEELEKQKAELQKSIEKNEKQKKEIEKQQAEIKAQTQQIEQQKEELAELIASLKEQEAKLEKNMKVLRDQEKLIKGKQIELRNKQRDLKDKEKQIATIEEDTKKKQEELRKVESKLEEAHEKISEDKNVINRAQEKIETQRSILYIVIAFLFFVVMAIFLIWRALAANKRINKELSFKNDEIKQQNAEIQSQALQLEQNNKELEKLSIVAGKAKNGIVIMDKEGNIEWVNAGFTKMYGYTLQLIINELDKNILYASGTLEIKNYFKKCINEKKHVTYEVENTKRNGEKIWVKTTLTPILDAENNISRIIAIDTDITEVKKAEQEIRKRNQKIVQQNAELEKLSIVARETDNAVLILDEKGNFEWVNQAFTRIFGYTFEELIKKDKNIIGRHTNDNIAKQINRALIHKKTSNYQFRTTTKEGKDIWVQATLTPILDSEGSITKIIAVDSDITKIKKAELQIIEKNEELEQQKEQIEFQNEQIHSSISYAQTIQSAILPIKSEMDKQFENFVIYLPKDIVSGDFYWFTNIEDENRTFVSAIDCTGHGVPGAFMSMIASRLLNEIVNEKRIYDPKDILSLMDAGVIKALRQKTSSNNDGLDMCLCQISQNQEQVDIQFGGAKRPLFYSKDGADIQVIKGTRRSIGGIKRVRNKAEFETKSLQLSKGDLLYLTTDGFSDQNNPERKRFGTQRFIRLLNYIKDTPMKNQQQAIEKNLFIHMKDAEQRDDITVIGVKL